MGTSVSRGIGTGRDDIVHNDGDESEGIADKYDPKEEAVPKDLEPSRIYRPASILSRLTSRPKMVRRDQFAGMLGDPSCYWVYARFLDQNNSANQWLFALEIKDKKHVPLPNPPMNTLADNASAVLDNNLYLIGGQVGSFVHNSVHVFEPALHQWSDPDNFNMLPRRAALAASVNGKVYVFGGCDILQIDRWGEVFDPSTNAWTPIPSSRALIHALDNGLHSLRTSAVLGKKIILRGSPNGIAFDVMSSSWTSVSDVLMKNWWNCVRAAVVQNLLITCHSEYDQHERYKLSIRAYDPDEDVWLMIEGIDRRFHKNAYRSQFLSVNGNLVIYHMWKKDDLRYSIFEIKERRRESVRFNLLGQSRFPIAKIIKKGNNLNLSGLNNPSTERPRKCIYVQNVLEAVRADGL